MFHQLETKGRRDVDDLMFMSKVIFSSAQIKSSAWLWCQRRPGAHWTQHFSLSGNVNMNSMSKTLDLRRGPEDSKWMLLKAFSEVTDSVISLSCLDFLFHKLVDLILTWSWCWKKRPGVHQNHQESSSREHEYLYSIFSAPWARSCSC